MSKARGQSLMRAIRRGNAVVFYNSVTKQAEVCYRKGSFAGRWKTALKNRLEV
ncbi:MAG: hypothetical protein LBG92_10445 [Prevotellaceae bacterium]|jgi:hypothetical protein|nr:hypothetical protein [Prevotellaceae bacterium]